MIDLYTWPTPNGRKVSILLEELGLDYTTHAIDITAGDQTTPAFLAISPNNKIPAIVERDTGLRLMESGAILYYLADKHGQFLPTDPLARAEVMQWLMWQMGGLGPMAGQGHHFLKYNTGASPYAEERFHNEIKRLYGVLNSHLAGRDYLCDAYSIADIACWPWISRYEWHRIDLNDYPDVQRWYQGILARPAVQRGYQVPRDMGPIPPG